ncbi:MAG: LysR family transcriptional regulator [Verrucomicrobiota bacterium]|nr:LysR family transcriptional regulator [Verrucomicrobiota bacterium]
MRIRVYANERMLGPGKMELLEAIAATGSLSAAAREMGMSYTRAWKLVQELNRAAQRPMVAMSRGGHSRGAATLSPFGEKVLGLYRQMDEAASKAAGIYGRQLARLLA